MKPHEVQTQSCCVSVSVVTPGQVIVQTVAETPVTPRPAATILLLRRGGRHADRELELLMVKRAETQSFMPGVWVFPGGIVERGEEPAACAVRELEEETGIALVDGAEVLEWARWITPEVVPVRFDTHFFVALAPAHSPPQPDGREVDDAGWFSPAGALARHRAGELRLVFPTIKTLEGLTTYSSGEAVMEAARGRVVEPILPRVVGTRQDHRVVLPGEDGYEEGVTDVEGLPS
jgi:8-oxo-dGTP pyrophosphatase MutT (NUDIX family)